MFDSTHRKMHKSGIGDDWGIQWGQPLKGIKMPHAWAYNDEQGNKFFHFLVTAYVNWDNGSIEKKFQIKIRTYPNPILDEDIGFTFSDTHS